MTLENFKYRTDPLFLRDQFSKQADIFGIPIIPKPYFSHEELQDLRLLGFDQIKRDEGRHKNRMVHFFLYDYKFEKIWDNPAPFVDLLRPYCAVLTPDFSMYTEMPPALQLYNTFRNRWCGAHLAEQGLRVVPTVSWGTEESFDFCFAGIEKGSIVAVSTYMFQAHGNHADQKELFMNGYRELLRRIEPEYVICYNEPFPEMEGNIIYVDYDLSSWKHMVDDIVPAEFTKHTHPVLTKLPVYDRIIKSGYVCKGSGSAYGGKWEPKKEPDKRFLGKPGEIITYTTGRGDKYETIIGNDGRAAYERHHTDHNQPYAHTNPHDHPIDWSNGYPNPQSPINYPDRSFIPNLWELLTMKTWNDEEITEMQNILKFEHFESISEFKLCMNCSGGEVEFRWHGKDYACTHVQDGSMCISEANKQETALFSNNIEEILDYLIDGQKLREMITDVEVLFKSI